MSVTLALDDEIDISRGDVLAIGDMQIANRFEAEMVWMDERPLDPSRVYAVKHMTRTTAAEIDRPLALNQIGPVVVSASRPLVFDPYVQNCASGSFIVIDPATNFTSGAGVITTAVHDAGPRMARPGVAERLAQLARAAASDHEAAEAIRHALEEIFT